MRRVVGKRRVVAVVLGLTLTGAVAACGSGEQQADQGQQAPGQSGRDVQQLLTKIDKKQQQTGTASVNIDRGPQGAPAGLNTSGDIHYTKQGTLDAHMTTKVPMGQGKTSNIEMVVSGEDFYVKMPPGEETNPAKPWVKVDPQGKDPISNLMGPMLMQMDWQINPLRSLEQLSEASRISGNKQENQNGQQLTHYTISLDLAKAAQVAKDPSEKKQFNQFLQNGTKSFDYQLWVNSRELPVRFEASQPMLPQPGQPPQQGGDLQQRTQYRDWGKDVHIAPPPANQIGPPPQPQGGAQQQQQPPK